MALGKTDDEIRAMPYPQWRRYQLFYILEPWGWADREYRTAAILAMMRNTNVSNAKDRKPLSFFIRDMAGDVLRRLLHKPKQSPSTEEMTAEERKAFLLAEAKRTFGVK